MNLDLGTVLLQWATGGLVFFLWTARRSVVGVGYGWLLRGVYGALGAIGLALEIRSDHNGAGHVVAIIGAAGLVVATLVAFAISWARAAPATSAVRSRSTSPRPRSGSSACSGSPG